MGVLTGDSGTSTGSCGGTMVADAKAASDAVMDGDTIAWYLALPAKYLLTNFLFS